MADSPYVGNAWFPQGSMLRTAHGSIAAGLLYGQVAMLMAATKPFAITQFLDSTAFAGGDEETRWLRLVERLAGAALAIDAIVLRGDDEAERAAQRVQAAHADVGVDPAMVKWVLVCLAYGEEETYTRLARALTATERERYWSDWRRLGACLGLSLADLPAKYTEYRQYLVEQLAGATLEPEERTLALNACLYLPGLPVPWRYRPLMPWVRLWIVEMLPDEVRNVYGVRRCKRWQGFLLGATAAVARRTYRVMPQRSPSLVDFEGLARVARDRRAAIAP